MSDVDWDLVRVLEKSMRSTVKNIFSGKIYVENDSSPIENQSQDFSEDLNSP